MQTRRGSIVEAFANIGVGFSLNLVGNLVILPVFGYDVTVADAMGIGVFFTAVALARSYLLRRYFNGLKFGQTGEAKP